MNLTPVRIDSMGTPIYSWQEATPVTTLNLTDGEREAIAVAGRLALSALDNISE